MLARALLFSALLFGFMRVCAAPALRDHAPTPLTEQPGDPTRGLAVVIDRDRGHCLLCHRIASIDENFQGTLGPDISTVGERLSPAQLRFRIVDSTRLHPDTAMPAYHRVGNFRQVGRSYQNRPVLTAQEVEDVIAYLRTLRHGDQQHHDGS